MELGERRRQILAAVVDDYVQTAEPVGSEHLVLRHDFGVKQATVRNELAAMSDLGYLRQPHTSAGRVPSDRGYRYYVDQLMPEPSLDSSETRRVRHGMSRQESEVEEIVQQTCRILSDITRYASLATPPQMESICVKHVGISDIGEGKLLVFTILSTGRVDHRVIETDARATQTQLIALGNLVSERFKNADLNGFSNRAADELPTELRGLKSLYKKIVAAAKQVLANAAEQEVYVEGTGHMLRQPEYADSQRLAGILETLDQRRSLFQILSSSFLGRNVTVIIGSENSLDEMHDCSFVASSYSVAGRPCGSIGVVGPTRMDYRRSVAAVKFMADNLSSLLASLSIW